MNLNKVYIVQDAEIPIAHNSNNHSSNNINHENSAPDENRSSELPRSNADDVQTSLVVNSRHESPHHRKQRKKSHLVIYATTFIMSIGFSIVLTGIWPYIKELDPSSSKEFFGWVVAINPLGQMIASPLLGWYGSKRGSNRCSFIITIIMFIGGNVMYALLPLFKRNVKYLMLISRFIVGISSANVAVCRAYISSSTRQKERTIALSITAASQSMGFILGPSLQTALAYAHPLPPTNSSILDSGDGSTHHLDVFNMYSLAGWFTALLGFLNFFLVLPCVYKEFNIAESEEIKDPIDNENGSNENKTDYVAILFLLMSYFCILLIYVIVETLVVPMCLDLYAWTDSFTVKVVGLGLTIIGIIAFFMFIIGGRLARLYNDRKIFILVGLVPLALSLLIFLPLYGETPKIKYCNATDSDISTPLLSTTSTSNTSLEMSRLRRAAISGTGAQCKGVGCPSTQEWCFYTPIIHIPQLIVGSCVMTLGYPVSISLAGAIFSKMLKAKEQGLWMGILTSAGSFSRFVGPLYVSYMYTNKGPLWTFATLFVLLSMVLIQNIIFYKRLKPLATLNVSGASQ